MTTPQLPPLPEQSMTHHITDEQIDALCLGLTGTFTRKERDRAVARAVIALAAPAQQGEPFGFFRALPFGWEQCAEGDEGAVALYTAPAPAVPSDERAAFEAWAVSVGYHTERDMFKRDEYQSTVTWALWRVWQARAALTDAPTPPAQCTNSDTWNCKYCKKASNCAALNDPRNFDQGGHKPQPIVPESAGVASEQVATSLTPTQIDDIINAGGYRNAAGGIYETSVYRFATDIEAAIKNATQPAVPEDVAREPMAEKWCWWIGDAETFHVADTESEAHSEAQSRIDDDCEPGGTHEYSVGRVQHPIDALGMEWLAEHAAETIEENACCWCDDNTGAEDPSITLAAEDKQALGTMVAAFLREKAAAHWWTADQKTITTHTHVAGSAEGGDAARAAEKGGA